VGVRESLPVRDGETDDDCVGVGDGLLDGEGDGVRVRVRVGDEVRLRVGDRVCVYVREGVRDVEGSRVGVTDAEAVDENV
jgi:hypothetical protein